MVLLLAVAGNVWAGAPAQREFDWGFLGSRDRDLQGNDRLRILGPFYERRRAEDGSRLLAVRPFYSSESDPGRDRIQRQILWPVAEFKDLQGERFWHVLTAFGNDYDINTPDSRYKVVVTPFLFAGRDKDGDGYFGLFPVGGRIKEFLRFDDFLFVLFPLYARAQVNDVVTHGVLWPLGEFAHGDDVHRVRVLPFYGRSVKDGLQEGTTVMWPIWNHIRCHYRGGSGYAWVLWPLGGYADIKDAQSYMLLPPFFRYSTSPDEKLLYCPWPFVQYSSGDIDKLYLWPLWGRRRQAGMDRTFLAWPIVFVDRHQRQDGVVRRFIVNPVLHCESRHELADGKESEEATGKYCHVWPLFSYNRQDDDAVVKCLNLWPLKGARAVDKNLAPFWTVATWRRAGEAREHELLWGLYKYRGDGKGSRGWSVFPLLRSERSAEGEGTRSCDLLRGLLGYRREGLRRQVRLLYFLNLGGRMKREPGEEVEQALDSRRDAGATVRGGADI